jgi:hypothetical protein
MRDDKTMNLKAFRMPRELEKRVLDVCTSTYCFSDFVLDAIYEKLETKTDTELLLVDAVAKLTQRMEKQDRDLNSLFYFMDHFVRNFLLYHEEKDYASDEERLASSKIAASRHDRFHESFKKVVAGNRKSFIRDLFGEIPD